jgi:hypothetical protein
MRSYLRFAAVIGAVTLGGIAAAPAVAATDNQSGANAVFVSIAGNGQGTGNVTATYSNGKETTTGNSKPAFPDPTGQKFITGGVLAQEATAKPGFSAACAGLAGDGGSVLNIGDSRCLEPGDLLTGSFGSFDPSQYVKAGQGQLTQALEQVPGLGAALGGVLGSSNPQEAQILAAINTALTQAKSAAGNGGLVINLDSVDGRCTAGNGGPTGDADLTNAKVQFITPAKTFTLLDFKPHPAPNTHLFTNLQQVADAIVNSFKSSLTEALDGNSQLSDALGTLQTKVIDAATSQLQANLGPLEKNLLDITLNQQVHPTADSIKVRALNVDVLSAAKAQLNGNPLVNLQIGNAACAPVARVAVSAPTAQAAAPKALPTSVSAGLATAPGDDSHSGIALAALAMMLTGGTALVVIRWLRA